jgi:hypothetical protein
MLFAIAIIFIFSITPVTPIASAAIFHFRHFRQILFHFDYFDAAISPPRRFHAIFSSDLFSLPIFFRFADYCHAAMPLLMPPFDAAIFASHAISLSISISPAISSPRCFHFTLHFRRRY